MTEVDPPRFRDFERATHDRVAASYEAFFAPVTANAVAPLLDAVQLSAGSRLLDVATGPGVVAARAGGRGAHVTGIDISPRMVSLAARRLPEGTFLEADVESLPFEEASFDAVVCAFGIGHFPDARAALRECTRVLAPGARLAVTWWDVPARNRLQGLMLEAIEEVGARPPPDLPIGPPIFQYSEDAALAEVLRAAKLGDVSVSTHSFSYRIPSIQALWDGALGSLARTSAVIRSQPHEVIQRIRDAFERRARLYEDPSGVTLPMSFKVGVGRKPERDPEPVG